jgi:hypothetical protein
MSVVTAAGHSLGQGAHRVLGRHVAGRVAHRDQSVDRGGVDDVPAVAFDHPGQEGLHAVDDAPQVDADDELPVGGRHLGEGRRDVDAGVVDQQPGFARVLAYAPGQIRH